MASRQRHDADASVWEIENVGDAAIDAAARAAAAQGLPLEVWLAETILLASQEGTMPPQPQIVTSPRRPLA